MEVVHFTPLQKRIISYRLDKESRVRMAELENMSVGSIDREIKEIAQKIQAAYEKNIIKI